MKNLIKEAWKRINDIYEKLIDCEDWETTICYFGDNGNFIVRNVKKNESAILPHINFYRAFNKWDIAFTIYKMEAVWEF